MHESVLVAIPQLMWLAFVMVGETLVMDTAPYAMFVLGRLSFSIALFPGKTAEPVPMFETTMLHAQVLPSAVLPLTESVFVAVRSGCVTVSDAEPLLPLCTLSVAV
jgi:hypothetical protein